MRIVNGQVGGHRIRSRRKEKRRRRIERRYEPIEGNMMNDEMTMRTTAKTKTTIIIFIIIIISTYRSTFNPDRIVILGRAVATVDGDTILQLGLIFRRCMM